VVQVEPLLVLSSQPCLVDASTTKHRCSNVQADILVCCISQSIAIIFTPCSSLGSQKCANLRLQWTKYVWRPGSAQTCWASISPPIPSSCNGGLLLQGRKGSEGKEREKGRGREKELRGEEGVTMVPRARLLLPPMVWVPVPPSQSCGSLERTLH